MITVVMSVAMETPYAATKELALQVKLQVESQSLLVLIEFAVFVVRDDTTKFK